MANCASEQILHKESSDDEKSLVGGLGVEFGYPEDSKKSKDKSKNKLWKIYFKGKTERRL
jgi:hypothetical protein